MHKGWQIASLPFALGCESLQRQHNISLDWPRKQFIQYCLHQPILEEPHSNMEERRSVWRADTLFNCFRFLHEAFFALLAESIEDHSGSNRQKQVNGFERNRKNLQNTDCQGAVGSREVAKNN